MKVNFDDEEGLAYQPTELTIARTAEAEEFNSKLGIVPNYGNYYKMIDRNFSYMSDREKRKWYPILKNLLRRLQNRTPHDHPIKFDLVVSNRFNFGDKEHTREQMEKYAGILKADLAAEIAGLDFRVCFWPWDEFHERLLLVNWIGIKFDEGFDIGEKERKQPISRVDTKRNIELNLKYTRESSLGNGGL